MVACGSAAPYLKVLWQLVEQGIHKILSRSVKIVLGAPCQNTIRSMMNAAALVASAARTDLVSIHFVWESMASMSLDDLIKGPN